MKVELTLALVKRLSLSAVPVSVNASGTLTFAPNLISKPKPYIVWDSHRDAPPGFGIKVAGKKTYVIRRKVDGVSIMPTVGNVADFPDLSLARKRAAELALAMVSSGKNPNRVARQDSAAELTIGAALSRYRYHLVTRTQKPAGAATLRVIDRVVRKFELWKWDGCKVRELSTADIRAKFIDGRAHVAATEQAFRLASTAVAWAISAELLDASAAGRPPALFANPFSTLTQHKLYRSRAQIAREREEKGARNPLSPSLTLGKFLEVAWSKQRENDNQTGVHFLLVMLLTGCRHSEHVQCKWRELLTEAEAKTTSHISLSDTGDYGPYIFFYQTKNGRNHRLPLGRMTVELLRRRQEACVEEVERRGFGAKSRQFVFPARSRFSKTGHYSDATALLESLREEAEIPRLANHDLRRSFGAVMTSLDVPDTIKRRFLNHADASVTDTYTKPEWAMLKNWMERIEQGILLKGPNVYNALKPIDWPAIAAPEPHACRPVKSRSGRPKKIDPADPRLTV